MKKSISVELIVVIIGIIVIAFAINLKNSYLGSNDKVENKTIMETKMDEVKVIDDECTEYLIAYLEAYYD